jgi:polar amino acid transport system substrate-binding protein
MSASNVSRRSFVALATASVAGLGLASTAFAAAKKDGKEAEEPQEVDLTTSVEPVLIEPGKLIVGSDCDYPPFTYLDGEDAAGFECDLLNAVCEVVGLECEYHTPLKFDTLVALVATNGTIDVAVSAITIDDERAETVDFTDPYFDSNQSVTVLKDSGILSVDDLAGGNIAVQSGTTGEAWAKENIDGATVTAFDEAPAAFAALQAGKADAAVIDLPVAVELLEGSYDNCEIIDAIPTGEEYGIAVSKDNPGLTELLNIGLAAIKENGTYQEIYDAYFSVGDDEDEEEEGDEKAQKDDEKADEKSQKAAK